MNDTTVIVTVTVIIFLFLGSGHWRRALHRYRCQRDSGGLSDSVSRRGRGDYNEDKGPKERSDVPDVPAFPVHFLDRHWRLHRDNRNNSVRHLTM